MTAQYVVNQSVFIAPDVLKEGTIINYDGPYGPHFDPVNEEAFAKQKEYYAKNPHAAINPVEALQMTMEVVAPPPIVAVPVNVGILGAPGSGTEEIRPGPESQSKVVAAAQANLAATEIPPADTPDELEPIVAEPSALDALKKAK